MRTEKEMLGLILDTAYADDRIRAVYMNGSRTNKNAPKDIFQDYDIVYAVTETEPFIEDKDWIRRFGEILFMQYPDEYELPGEVIDRHSHYGFLMMFSDGNRLDLTVQRVEYVRENILTDRLCRVLLDKDGCLPTMPEPSDADHLIRKPDQKLFSCVCNEFWWCLNNIAKGLWRGEPTYVQDMLNCVVRPQLLQMLSWKAGILTDWTVSSGKSGKYLPNWLSSDEWQRYLSTYCGAGIEEIRDAVFRMCDQFAEVSGWVAGRLGFELDRSEADGSMRYLKAVTELPEDADSVF